MDDQCLELQRTINAWNSSGRPVLGTPADNQYLEFKRATAQVERRKRYFSNTLPLLMMLLLLTKGLQGLIVINFIEWDDGEAWK